MFQVAELTILSLVASAIEKADAEASTGLLLGFFCWRHHQSHPNFCGCRSANKQGVTTLPLQTLCPENSKKNTHKLLHSLRPRVFWVAKISSNQTKANMKFRKNRPQDAHGFPWSISQAPLATCNSRRHVPTIHLRNLRTDPSGKTMTVTVDDLFFGCLEDLWEFQSNNSPG